MNIVRARSIAILLIAFGLTGCGGSNEDRDAGTRDDAGMTTEDGATPDAGRDGGPVFPTGPAGTLDTSFGDEGVLSDLGLPPGDDTASSVTVQPDQRILVGGHYAATADDDGLYVLRLLDDGQRDESFADGGVYLINRDVGGSEGVNAMVVQSDGRIVVAADAGGFLLFRLDESGALDTSFGTDGYTLIEGGGIDRPHALRIDSMGRLVVIGGNYNDALVTRLDPDGVPDASFHGGVPLLLDFGANETAVAGIVRADDSIVIGGQAFGGTSQGFVAAITEAGEVDATFAGGHVLTGTLAVGGIVAQGASFIVVGQDPTGFAAERFGANGATDSAFGTGGIAEISAPGGLPYVYGAVGSRGNIYSVGSNGDVVLAAWLEDGTPYAAFGPGSATALPIGPEMDNGFAIASTPDGRLVVVGNTRDGEFDSVVARFFP